MVREEIAVVTRLIDRGLGSGLRSLQKVIRDTQNIAGGLTRVTQYQGRVYDILAQRLATTADISMREAYSLLGLVRTKKDMVDLVYRHFQAMKREAEMSMRLRGYTEDMIKAATKHLALTRKEIASWGTRKDIINKMITVQEEQRKGMRRFRMELLSTMFFGEMISRTFGRMVAPALKAAGATEIYATTLKVAFLPAALPVLRVQLLFLQAMMAIPAPIRMGIGLFFMLISVLGKLLAVQSATILGLTGLAQKMGITIEKGETLGTTLRKLLKRFRESRRGTQTYKGALIPLAFVLSALKRGIELTEKAMRKIKDRMDRVRMGSKGTAGSLSMLSLIFPALALAGKGLQLVLAKLGAAITGISWPLVAIIALLVFLFWLFTSGRKVVRAWGEKTLAWAVMLKAKLIMLTDSIRKKWESLKEKLGRKVKPIVEWAMEKWNILANAFTTAKAWIGKAFEITIGWVKSGWETIEDAFSMLGKWIKSAWETTVTWTAERWEDIENAFTQLTDWIKDFWKAKVSFVTDTSWDYLASAFEQLTDWVDRGWEVVVKFGKSVSSGLSDFISQIRDWVSTGFSIAVNFVKGLFEDVQELGEKIAEWARTGFEIAIDFVIGAGKEIWNFLKKAWERVSLTIGLSRAERGGIFTRPTVTMVAERGPEAVIPLGKGIGFAAPSKVVNIYASPTFNISATVSSEIDIEELANELNARFEESLRTLIR